MRKERPPLGYKVRIDLSAMLTSGTLHTWDVSRSIGSGRSWNQTIMSTKRNKT